MYHVERQYGNADEGMGLLKAAVLMLSLLSVLLALAFGADWLLRPDHFPVRHVRFEGEFKHVTRSELEQAVVQVVRGNFFLLDLDQVKARVEALPWVYQASVRRQWPQDVHVRFVEQQLATHWGDRGFLNQAGELVRVSPKEIPPGLPRLSGPDGTGSKVLEAFKKFSQILAAADLTLKAISLTPGRVWQLHLAEGMDIILDRDQSEHRLERFARIYTQALKGRVRDIQRVDLRYANGFAIQPSGHQASGQSNQPGREDAAGGLQTAAASKG